MSGDLSQDEGIPQLNFGCLACLVDADGDYSPCFPEGSAHPHCSTIYSHMQLGKSNQLTHSLACDHQPTLVSASTSMALLSASQLRTKNVARTTTAWRPGWRRSAQVRSTAARARRKTTRTSTATAPGSATMVIAHIFPSHPPSGSSRPAAPLPPPPSSPPCLPACLPVLPSSQISVDVYHGYKLPQQQSTQILLLVFGGDGDCRSPHCPALSFRICD